MFINYAKLAIMEALRNTFNDSYTLGDKPIRVDIEYPEEENSWPALFVQFTPETTTWAGVNPDEFKELVGDPEFQWIHFRRGMFTGYYDLTILTTTSHERDKLWDTVVQLFLFGKGHAQTDNFYETIEEHDLIGIVFYEGDIGTVGSSAGLGTPWKDDIMTYEATIRVRAEGEFYANIFEEKLVSLTEIRVKEPIHEDEEYADDGQGVWTEL